MNEQFSRFTQAANQFLLSSYRQEVENLTELDSLLNLVHRNCELVHLLQRERGLSNIFLASKGVKMASEREDAIANSLALSDELLIYLNDAVDIFRDRGLLNAISIQLSKLADLSRLRQKISELHVEPVDSTLQFNETIESLLAVVFDVAYLANDPEVTKALSALFHIIQMKELVGQERAWTSVGFARGYFVERLALRLKQVMQEESDIINGFLLTASSQLKELLQRLHASKVQQELDQMREVRNQLYELSKIDVELADVWFQKSTSYIDALREIEIKASEHVKFVCEKQMQMYRSADNTKNVVSTPPGFDGSSPLKSVTTQQRDQILQLEIELEKARTALNDRKLIERAKSVLREKMEMSDEQAHRQLQKSAMEQNIPMVLVCQKILDTMDSLSK
jgi:hypothetical protein